jgi:hypothetical protein
MPIRTIQSTVQKQSRGFYAILLYGTLLFLLGLPASSGATTNDLHLVAEFEGARLYNTVVGTGEKSHNVVRLRGSFRQMGRQYGGLLGVQMTEFYNAGVNYLLTKVNPKTYNKILEDAGYYFAWQPQEGKDFIEGMAETSGLNLDQQKITASLMNQIYLSLGCSSLMAWSDYTGGGPLVIGRNFDTALGPFGSYAKYLTVVVYNPVGGGNALAEVNYVGCVFFQTGMNKHGIYMDYHNGKMSGGSTVYDTRQLGGFLMFTYLLNYSTLDRIDQEFMATLPEVAAIINVADKTKAYVYEWPTWATKRRVVDPERVFFPPPLADGLLVSTNHFVDPTWGWDIYGVDYGATYYYTIERRINLLTLGEKYKGSLDVPRLKYIFNRTFWTSPDPGPTFPSGSNGDTVIQVIAVPANLELWIKAPGYSEWQGINLNPLFYYSIVPAVDLLLRN